MTTNIQTATVDNPVFPNITVKLTNHDRNIFSVLSTIKKALKKHNVSENDQLQFRKEVLGSNCYNSALNVCFRWVTIT